MSEKRKTGDAWSVRLGKDREERATRAAKALGLVEDSVVAKGKLLRFGLDLVCKHAIRKQIDQMGGLMAAMQAEARGLRQVLLDAVAVTGGSEFGLLDLLGATKATWLVALDQYPDVNRAFAAEIAKRESL